MWELIKEYLSLLFLIAGALGIGVTLVMVAVYGAVVITERNHVVLYLELAWCAGAVVLGLERAWRVLRR